MNTFKIGDIVRRKPEFQNDDWWVRFCSRHNTARDQAFEVFFVDSSDGIQILKGYGYASSDKFDLVAPVPAQPEEIAPKMVSDGWQLEYDVHTFRSSAIIQTRQLARKFVRDNKNNLIDLKAYRRYTNSDDGSLALIPAKL